LLNPGKASQSPDMKTAALYVHVPFCEHKCIYCDFYSVITQKDRQNYLEAVKTEIDSFADQYNDLYEFDTIFFGGGTPSLLAPRELDSLMNYFLSRLRFSSSIEITLETNPGTIDETKLFDFNNAGINRLSIGIQSFQQNDLEFLTRIHNRQQAIDAVAGARKAGFKNINIDLMFNLNLRGRKIWLLRLILELITFLHTALSLNAVRYCIK
jgi:oxygen-independent coproporphyrinogen-3 oxidase